MTSDDPLIGFSTETLRFDSLLGKGAMGTVYKGVQLALDRPVAIKVIASHLANDAAYRERFSREAQTLGRLLHPHVIACHDVGPCPGPEGTELFVMVLEYVDGWSLGHLLKKQRLSVRQVLELHRQAAEGLAAAHHLGIVHRDIKPDNIMVTRSSKAKLADFGLAKADDSASMTQTGALLGSPSYMSPEACRGEPPNPSWDLYSLSCSLFHALTGTTPYTSTSALQAIQQHVNSPIPLLSSRRQDLVALDGLLLRGLAKTPQERAASAKMFAQELAEAIPMVSSELLVGGGTQPVSSRIAKSPTMLSGHRTSATSPTQSASALNSSSTQATMLMSQAPPPAPAAPEPASSHLRIPIIAALVLVLALLCWGLFKPKAEPVVIPPDSRIAIIDKKLSHIREDLKQKNLEDAKKELDALTIPSDPVFAAVTKQYFQLGDDLLLAQKAEIDAEVKSANADAATMSQTQKEQIQAIQKYIDAEDFENAKTSLTILRINPELQPELAQVQQNLTAALDKNRRTLLAKLTDASSDLDNGKLPEALKLLQEPMPAGRFPDLDQRHAELLDKARKMQHALAKTTPPPVSTNANTPTPPPSGLSDVVFLRKDQMHGRDEEFGNPFLPFLQPLPATTLLAASEYEFSSGRQVVNLSIHPIKPASKYGLTLMLYDHTGLGKEGSRPLLIECTINGRTTTLLTQVMQVRKWNFVQVDLPQAETMDIRLSMPDLRLVVPARERPALVGTRFFIARPAYGIGGTPSVADLGIKPGTLEPIVKERNADSLTALIDNIIRLHDRNFDPKKFRLLIAGADGTDISDEDHKILRRLCMLMLTRDSNAKDVGDHTATYPSLSGLGSLFEDRDFAANQLVFLKIGGALNASPGPAREVNLFIQKALAFGIMPVLILEPPYGDGPDAANATQGLKDQAVENRKHFVEELRKEQPSLPVIDLNEVLIFYRQYLGGPPKNPLIYQQALLDGVEAGVRELHNRIQFVIGKSLPAAPLNSK